MPWRFGLPYLGRGQTMRIENFPEPISDPEREGLPGTADDDSSAWDDVESGREADGLDPAALPSDEPLGVDRFGTTFEEAQQGESITSKLAREEPDALSVDPGTRADAADRFGSEAFDADAATEDADLVDRDTSLDAVTVDAHRDSPVSVYDADDDGLVGRLVEPDEGVRE